MLEFLIDSIFVIFGGRVSNSAPLLADLFLYSYKADFIQGLLKKNEKTLARSLSFMFRYIDHVLSPTDSRFGDFVHRLYPIEH